MLVRGVPASVTNDYISLYFENQSGTDVTDTQRLDDYVIITFAKYEGDANIIVLLCASVVLFYDCLYGIELLGN